MIVINIDKAKTRAHEMRREARAKEFEPYDKVIMAQIPGQSVTDAENDRAAIRAKYAVIQAAIDGAETLEGIKNSLESLTTPSN